MWSICPAFVVYDEVTEHWYEKATSTESEYFQTTEILGSDLDPQTNLGKVDIKIPITDPSLNYSGDEEFIFGVCIEKVKRSIDTSYTTYPFAAAYGDLIISTDGLTKQDNHIECIVNNKFLNTKRIELDLFDTTSLNYTNGLTTGADLTDRTIGWYDDSNVTMPIADRIIKNKFQLYSKSRQSITSTVFSSDYLKPMSMWYDSNQPNKKFILVGYTQRPTQEQYDCVWNEYNNTETININNV